MFRFGLHSKNIRYLYFSKLIGGLLFLMPILALYLEKELFTVTNVTLVLAIGSLCLALFEVPSGAVADLFGRKKTLLLAEIISIGSLVMLAIGGNLTTIIIYSVLRALSRSLMSGTDGALIFDTLKAEKKESLFKKIYGTYFALWAIGAGIGSLIGGFLAEINLIIPVLASIIPATASFCILLKIKEPDYEKEQHRNILKQMLDAGKIAISKNQVIFILLGGFFIYAFTETIHELNPLYFSFKEVPLLFFGIATAITFICSSAGHYSSHWVSKHLGNKQVLVFSAVGSLLFIIMSTLTTSYLSVLLYVFSSYFFGVRYPVINYLLNLEAPSSKRATIISIGNLAKFIGYAAFVPIIGLIAKNHNINTAFFVCGLGLILAIIAFLFVKNKE
jgi:MFS family permease